AARIHRQHPVGADDHAFKLFSLLSRTGHALHRLLKDIRARDFSFPYSYTTQILISLYFFEKKFCWRVSYALSRHCEPAPQRWRGNPPAGDTLSTQKF
ncbi:MAG: hypothetical protein K6G66_06060, partial [Oscillospiraceae bacterium]|nr:hypothetical protein [Oscillospiraceae bacterium]